jgi:serine phosphatase RsbU (regulator of sigma subunit)
LEYEILRMVIPLGDVFVFASDGILESMNAHEVQSGFERLVETLSALPPSTSSKAMCAASLSATDKFSGRPEEPHDHRTLIVLGVNGKQSRSSLKKTTTTEPPNACRN